MPFLYLGVARDRADGIAAATIAVTTAALAYVLILSPFGVRVQSGNLPIPIPGMGLVGFLPTNAILSFGIGHFAFFATIALSLSEGINRKWGLSKLGAVSLATGLAVFSLSIAAAFALGNSFLAGMNKYLTNLVGEIIKANTTAGGGEVYFITERAGEIISFILGISPSLIFVFALLVVVLNLLASRRFIRSHHAFSHLHNTARFRMPDWLVWAVVANGVAFFADHYIVHAGWLSMVSINALICLGAIYFFQGLAVIVYFLQGLRLPLLRALAYVAIVVFFQTIGMIIVAIGLADVWADFRLRSWRTRHHNT